ncbi:MAG: GGDEF domain-containing protein [Bacilli bacterium]|nr:MAG: GGDEF domain-containing protein [Bacilli bacterium]
MFSYYVSTVDYNTIKYKTNTNSKIYEFSLLAAFLVGVLLILLAIFIIFIIKKKKSSSITVKDNDKLKYIDTMTSLKNRAYLNLKIKEWDDNVIYPQAFVVIDLNNIKNINDSHGHEEGDTIIKKAASVLIVNQEPNTDIVRTDGNEFLVYMVGYTEKEVISYTRKIYKELKRITLWLWSRYWL